MKKNPNHQTGKFNAIDSFITQPNNQFGIIGDLLEGKLEPGMFLNIPLNKSLNFTIVIDQVLNIKFAGKKEKHLLILINETKDPDNEGAVELLLTLNIAGDVLNISTEG